MLPSQDFCPFYRGINGFLTCVSLQLLFKLLLQLGSKHIIFLVGHTPVLITNAPLKSYTSFINVEFWTCQKIREKVQLFLLIHNFEQFRLTQT